MWPIPGCFFSESQIPEVHADKGVGSHFSVLEADFQEEVNDASNMVVEEESDKEPMSFSTVNLAEDSQKSKGNLGHFPSFKFGVDKSK